MLLNFEFELEGNNNFCALVLPMALFSGMRKFTTLY